MPPVLPEKVPDIELHTNGIDRIMPECSTEAIFVPIATAATFAVGHTTIFAKLVATEAQIRILNTSKTISRFLTGMQTPFRCHLELREVFFHITVWLLVFEAALIS